MHPLYGSFKLDRANLKNLPNIFCYLYISDYCANTSCKTISASEMSTLGAATIGSAPIPSPP